MPNGRVPTAATAESGSEPSAGAGSPSGKAEGMTLSVPHAARTAVPSQGTSLSVTELSLCETGEGCQLPQRNPSMRLAVDHALDGRHTEDMHSTGVRLVARRHVDFRRVSSAMCRRSA